MTYDKGYGYSDPADRNMSSPTAFGFANKNEDGALQTSGGSDFYRNMSPGTEDFWLGRATSDYPVYAPGGLLNAGLKFAGQNIIDNRLDAIQDSFSLYNNIPTGKMVASDENGNLQLVDDPVYLAQQAAARKAANGGRSSTGDSGYVSGNYGGHTISYGTADSQGRNSAGHTAGGTGRTDGGYGW